MRVHGSFDVKTTPLPAEKSLEQSSAPARLSLEKTFQGPLEAVGRGEMLAVGGGQGDGAYVAMERITGTLDGRAGSFALVHRALMRNSIPAEWTVIVVPGSGTGELAGLDGAMTITIEGGRHLYDLDYTLPGR